MIISFEDNIATDVLLLPWGTISMLWSIICVAQHGMIYYEWAFDQNIINLLNNYILIVSAKE